MNLIGLKSELEKIDAERKATFDNRTDVNREAKSLEAQLKALPTPEQGLPEKETSAAELLAEIEEINKKERYAVILKN